jgi:release factor glutamine methyltransferase
MPTIGDALYQSSRLLLDAGIDTGSLEASLLLGRATGLDRLRLINHTADTVADDALRQFEDLLERRLKREPLQYILGNTEFMGLVFQVNPSVLIPRPDTEILVEAVLDLEEVRGNTPITAADIGTGSGAIAIALAKFLPYLTIIATDICPDALALAKTNADLHGVAHQVQFRHGDGLFALDEPVHYLISNPPYIAEGVIATLEPEVRDYEPKLALTPGPDAYHWYRQFAHTGAKWVLPDGYLALEVGAGQATTVCEILNQSGHWERARISQDLTNIDRVITAQRCAKS